jgi:hypothetical protein
MSNLLHLTLPGTDLPIPEPSPTVAEALVPLASVVDSSETVLSQGTLEPPQTVADFTNCYQQFVGGQDDATQLNWCSQTSLPAEADPLGWMSHAWGKAGLVGVGGLAVTLIASPLLSQVQQQQATPTSTAPTNAPRPSAQTGTEPTAVAPPSLLPGPEFSATQLAKLPADPLPLVPIPALATQSIRAPLAGQVLRQHIAPLNLVAASGGQPPVFPLAVDPVAETPLPPAPAAPTLSRESEPTPTVPSPLLELPPSAPTASAFEGSTNLAVAATPLLAKFTPLGPIATPEETTTSQPDPAMPPRFLPPSADESPLAQTPAFDLPPSEPVNAPSPPLVTLPVNEQSQLSGSKSLGLWSLQSTNISGTQEPSEGQLPLSGSGKATFAPTPRGTAANDERTLGLGAAMPRQPWSQNQQLATSITPVEPLPLSVRAAITATNSTQINNLRVVQLSPEDYQKTWAAFVAKGGQSAPEYGFIDHLRQTIIMPTM